MKRLKLPVEKRTVVGRNVRKLRREGILPANIYGKEIQSEAVQLPLKEFQAIYKEVGQTGLVDVQLDGQTRPVLIHDVHIDSVTRMPLHADFYQVNLKEKITTMVPVVAVGEPKAVTEKIGLLLQPVSEVEVEALPEALPENIEVNVVPLAQVGDQLTIADLKTPAGVTILTEASQVVVKIDDLISEEAKADAQAAEAAAEEAAEEGTAPAEGEAKESSSAEASEDKEAKAEEKPAEEKKEE